MARQRRLTVTFDGSSAEYFRVWIVNVCLCLLTFGLYAPWAKVRKKQYLYGQTRLDGTPFRYVAPPLAILKGQLLSLMVVAAFSLAAILYPDSSAIGSASFLVALPWIWLRSIAFEARHTSFRNLRFEFAGTYARAFGCLAGALLLALTIVGLPWAYCRVRTYVVNRLGYGGIRARIVWSGEYLLLPFLITVGVVAITIWFVKSQLSAVVSANGGSGAWVVASSVFVSFGAFVLVASLLEARTANVIGRRTTLGPLSFKPSYRARDFLSLYLINTFAVVGTLGLLVPWATVRLARYRASRVVVLTRADWAEFTAVEAKATPVSGAFAESLADRLEVIP